MGNVVPGGKHPLAHLRRQIHSALHPIVKTQVEFKAGEGSYLDDLFHERIYTI